MNSSSQEITYQSRSNLAFTLSVLPGQRRKDMIDFYAFCRVIDDIADHPERAAEQKRMALDTWKQAAEAGFPGEDWLYPQLRRISQRHAVPTELFCEIIDGVSRDIEPASYDTFDDLLGYCYQVASAVGLVSIRIFGCGDDENARHYAINLGYALQLTNIMRDVGEDIDNDGRCYLPNDILGQFGVTRDELREHCHTPAFTEMMHHLHLQASTFYDRAAARIHPSFHRRLIAAEMMASTYRRILNRMQADGYRVFDRRYGLSKLEKAGIFVRSWVRSKWIAPFPRD
jgi:phytoene synthase